MTDDIPIRRHSAADELANLAHAVTRVETKLDVYIAGHTAQHTASDAMNLPTRVRDLEDFRLEFRAYGRLLKMTLGTSVLAIVATMASILYYLDRLAPPR